MLVGNDAAIASGIALPSRVFGWLALVFGVGFSMLALLTRRWALAWIALAGSTVASFTGLLAVWSRQTAPAPHPGPGIGLIIAWIAVIVLTFHWARVVWARTALQLAAEEERRRAVAKRQKQGPARQSRRRRRRRNRRAREDLASIFREWSLDGVGLSWLFVSGVLGAWVVSGAVSPVLLVLGGGAGG